MPPGMLARLRDDKKAWDFWEAALPSYRKGVAHWVTSGATGDQ